MHGEHCGCGCAHTEPIVPEGLTRMQVDILLALAMRRYLPVACFSLAKEGVDGPNAIALDPVYLSSPDDSMELVKEIGAELVALEEGGLITLDYDLPLKGYPYEEYITSDLYALFVQTVKEATALPDHAYDTPVLELGCMALTEAGEGIVASLTMESKSRAE